MANDLPVLEFDAIVVGGGGGVAQNMGTQQKKFIEPMRECIELLTMMAKGVQPVYQFAFMI